MFAVTCSQSSHATRRCRLLSSFRGKSTRDGLPPSVIRIHPVEWNWRQAFYERARARRRTYLPKRSMRPLCVDLYLTTLPHCSYLSLPLAAATAAAPVANPDLIYEILEASTLPALLYRVLSLSLCLSFPHPSHPHPLLCYRVDSWLVFPRAHVYIRGCREETRGTASERNWRLRFVHFRGFVPRAATKGENLFRYLALMYRERRSN